MAVLIIPHYKLSIIACYHSNDHDVIKGFGKFNRNYFYIYVANNSFYSNEKTASKILLFRVAKEVSDRICFLQTRSHVTRSNFLLTKYWGWSTSKINCSSKILRHLCQNVSKFVFWKSNSIAEFICNYRFFCLIKWVTYTW